MKKEQIQKQLYLARLKLSLLLSTKPVSYTHLDVYKRQVENTKCHVIAASIAISRVSPSRISHTMITVSYTHLDVYKRQS